MMELLLNINVVKCFKIIFHFIIYISIINDLLGELIILPICDVNFSLLSIITPVDLEFHSFHTFIYNVEQ